MNANELADKLLEDLREVDLFNMDSDMYGNRQHYIEQLESLIRQQQAEIEALKNKCLKLLDLMIIREGQPNKPSGDWWKGDPTCGGLTENYGLGKAQDK